MVILGILIASIIIVFFFLFINIPKRSLGPAPEAGAESQVRKAVDAAEERLKLEQAQLKSID